MAEQPRKLHIALFPWLAFGHIIPYFELAVRIAQKGHKISFISTPRNIKRLPKLPPSLQPSIELIELSLPDVDKLPEDAEATSDIPQEIVPFLKKALDGLQEPLSKFLERSAPDCLLYDFAAYWLQPICSKLGILGINFSIFSAFGASCISDYIGAIDANEPTFDERPNKAVLQDYADKALSETHIEQDESGVSDIFRVRESIRGAQAIAIRSCMEIEGESIKYLENFCRKPVIPVGLLPPSLQFGTEDSKAENWHTILKWLDKQEKGSVIYVAFGSEAVLSEEDIMEIAMGLEQSGLPFLWVLKKQNSSAGSGSVELQDWLVNKASKHGMVWSNWVPQVRILAHKSIGGFLTHCGWSSVLESLQVGCPLILLPFHNEQVMIARLMEVKKVGIKVPRNEHDGKFTRDSVAKALRSVILMEDEGKTCRSHAEEMSKIIGDKELNQKYVDEFVDYLKIRTSAIKD